MIFRSKTTTGDLVKPGRDGDRSRAEVLEDQVKYLAATAAQAVDRATDLERELESLRKQQERLQHNRSDSEGSDRSLFSNNSSASQWTSLSSDEERSILLQTLEHERSLRRKYEQQLGTGNKFEGHYERKLGAAFGTIEADYVRVDEKSTRLHQLEVALTAIHRARRAISRSQRYI